jgi:hypothetical protein
MNAICSFGRVSIAGLRLIITSPLQQVPVPSRPFSKINIIIPCHSIIIQDDLHDDARAGFADAAAFAGLAARSLDWLGLDNVKA